MREVKLEKMETEVKKNMDGSERKRRECNLQLDERRKWMIFWRSSWRKRRREWEKVEKVEKKKKNKRKQHG